MDYTLDCRQAQYIMLEKPQASAVTVCAVSEPHLSCLGKSQKGEDSFANSHPEFKTVDQSACTLRCSSIAQCMIVRDVCHRQNGVCIKILIRFFLIGKTSQMFNICYVFPNCIFPDFVMFFLILLGFP